jgi:hypothetical protein
MTNQIQLSNEYNDAIVQFLRDAGLASKSTDQDSTPEEKLQVLITALGDLFSMQEPTIDGDLDKTLRTIARDAKLSNIMRERALYRLYLVTTTTKEHNGAQVPMWYGIVDDDGVLLTSQEEFIRLFTKQSGIGRASTFRRIRVYNQLATFGITGQDAWIKVLQMPYTIQELMEDIANWKRSEFLGVPDDVALGITKMIMPERVALLEEVLSGDHTADNILEVYSPVIQKMFAETDTYTDAKEALRHIKHDIMGVPTVAYRWSVDEEVIVVTVTVPIIQNGHITSEEKIETVIYIDALEPPKALLDDLFKRLPIHNRHDLQVDH